MSSCVDIDIKGKGMLILGVGRTEELDNTMLAAEAQYSINFSIQLIFSLKELFRKVFMIMEAIVF